MAMDMQTWNDRPALVVQGSMNLSGRCMLASCNFLCKQAQNASIPTSMVNVSADSAVHHSPQ